MANKIDSNLSGLRWAAEVSGSPKTLAGTEVWRELEPNSYSDFGANVTSTARTPITAGRQRKKGRVTDLEAQAGFNIDFTGNNMVPHMEHFMFAAWRASQEITDFSGTAITAVDDDYTKTGGFADIVAQHMLYATGFGVAANNGLKVVSARTDDTATVTPGLADEAVPPATSSVKLVGVQGTAAEFAIDATDPALPILTSSTFNLTTLGLIPGQWVWIGGDDTALRFASAGNNGFARVKTVAAGQIVFDKTQNTMVTDLGTGKTVQLFIGDLIKNENDPDLIVTQTVQFERKLGAEGYEYVKGCFANELTMNMQNSSKIALDLAYVAMDSEYVAPGGRKAGTFPAIATDSEAFNTSSDFVRIRASAQGSASPLFGYIQEMNLSINNNVSVLKALGVLGGFDATIGDFVVGGTITAYFNDLDATSAVRNSDSLSIDFAMSFDNRGWVFDVPLFTGSDGLLNVEKDQPITIPVTVEAAEDTTLLTTLIVCYFPYLPTLAAA